MSWSDPDLAVLLLPLVIFVAELCVVTVGTLRIIFVARGHKFVAPALGFLRSGTDGFESRSHLILPRAGGEYSPCLPQRRSAGLTRAVSPVTVSGTACSR